MLACVARNMTLWLKRVTHLMSTVPSDAQVSALKTSHGSHATFIFLRCPINTIM